MIKNILIISYLLLFLSYKYDGPIMQYKRLSVRVFNFKSEGVHSFTQKVKFIKNSQSSAFIYYNGTQRNDTLKIFKNDRITFRNTVLKKIDAKTLIRNNTEFVVEKHLYEDNMDIVGDRYIFVNRNEGIIFTESLFSGAMLEYDADKNHNIHKAIALRKLGFKNGSYELQFGHTVYPD